MNENNEEKVGVGKEKVKQEVFLGDKGHEEEMI